MKSISIGASKISGKGIIADEPIRKGEIIQRINGRKVHRLPKSEKEARQIMNWIGIGKQTWINTEGTPFRFINHSCEPNAAIIGTKTVIALKNIKRGEEIFMDYSLTDADPHWSMACSCGARTCRNIISSIQSVPTKVFKKHAHHIPRNFQRIYLRSYVLAQQPLHINKPVR